MVVFNSNLWQRRGDNNQVSSPGKRVMTGMHKEEGNKYFKRGKFREAIAAYSAGLGGLKTESSERFILLVNRCAAFLKIKRIAALEETR